MHRNIASSGQWHTKKENNIWGGMDQKCIKENTFKKPGKWHIKAKARHLKVSLCPIMSARTIFMASHKK